MTSPQSDDEDGGPAGDRVVGDGAGPGFDEAAVYRAVREAVEDAILGALGTLMLVGIAVVAVWVGGVATVRSQTRPSIAFGVLAIAGGFYLAAASLGVVPPAREWF